MDSGELDFYQHTKVCSNTCRSTKIDLTSARVSLSSQTSTEYIPLTPASTDGTCSDSWHLCSKRFAGLKQNWCCIPNVPYDCLSTIFCLAVCFYSAFSPCVVAGFLIAALGGVLSAERQSFSPLLCNAA